LLSDDDITKIISSYGIEIQQARKYAGLCSGSPGVAHIIGLNLKKNPENLLQSPDTVNFWDRYIVGGDDPSNPAVEDRRRVLRYLSLFKRFGFEEPYTNEAISISRLIERNFSSITWGDFRKLF
jgi:hypothetical protein